MIYKVHMLAFMDGEIREVVISDDFLPCHTKELLELIYRFGQNDFQPVENRCSVSIGDVAEIDGKFHICKSLGWEEISDTDLDQYRKIDAFKRTFSKFVR
jgi:hypothetical protein